MRKEVFFITFILFLFFLFLKGISFSEEIKLNLDKCVNLSLENNPQLLIVKSRVEQAKGVYDRTHSAILPKLKYGFDYSKTYPMGIVNLPVGAGFQQIIIQPEDNYILYAGFSCLITTFGRVEAAVAATYFQIKFAEANYLAAINDTRYNTKKSYFDFRQLEMLENITEEGVKLAEGYVVNSNSLYKNGIIPKYDLIRMDYYLSQAKFNYETALKASEVNKLYLLNQIGISVDSKVEFDKENNFDVKEIELNLDELKKTAMEKRPEIVSINMAVKSSNLLLNSAKSGYNPDLMFTSSYQILPVPAGFTGNSNNWVSLFRISWPIFDSGETVGKIKEAEAQLKQVEMSSYEMKQKILLEVQDAFLTYKEAVSKYKTAEKSLEQAKEALRVGQIRYKEGVSTSLELQDTNNSFLRAQADYVNAVYLYYYQ